MLKGEELLHEEWTPDLIVMRSSDNFHGIPGFFSSDMSKSR